MFTANKFPVRQGQVLLLWIALFICYVQRINISVGMVAMTNEKLATGSNYYSTFDWTETEKGFVLSSFFWGYLVLQIFFGPIVEKMGSKMILAASVTSTSVLAVATPFAANTGGYAAVSVLRICQGLVQGALYPCITVHVSKWVPPIERLRALSFCFSGSPFAPLIGFPLCGFLASSSGGWPSVFYVTGGLGFVWVVLWLRVGANSPKDHATISDAERTYIETAIEHDVNASKNLETPWKHISTSLPVYAMVVSSFVVMWGYWTLLVEMPIYMSAVLKLDMKQNGLLSSLPYLSASLCTLLYSFVAAYISKHYEISRTTHRNIWNSISTWGSAIVLLILSLISRPSTSTAVLLLVLTVSLMSALFNGYGTNSIDLAPNFCGTLQGITSTAGTLAPLLGPLCVGWLVTDPSSADEWNYIFQVTSSMMFIGNIFYIIFSSSEVQSWNESGVDESEVRQ